MDHSLAGLRGERLRDEAAAAVCGRIAADARRAGAKLRPVFVYLEQYLFDRGLQAQALAVRYQGSRRSFWRDFVAHVGCAPYEYVKRHRLEVAEVLIRTTELELRRIAELLGFPAKSFSRIYSEWSGETPSQRRASLPAPGPDPAGRFEEASAWRQALTADRAAGPDGFLPDGLAFLDAVARRYPHLQHRLANRTGTGTTPEDVVYEAFKAATLGRVVAQKPSAVQASLVASAIPLRTLLLHDHLSAQADRAAPERAAHLRRLALASLDACAAERRPALAKAIAVASLQLARLDLHDAAQRLLRLEDAKAAVRRLLPTNKAKDTNDTSDTKEISSCPSPTRNVRYVTDSHSQPSTELTVPSPDPTTRWRWFYSS